MGRGCLAHCTGKRLKSRTSHQLPKYDTSLVTRLIITDSIVHSLTDVTVVKTHTVKFSDPWLRLSTEGLRDVWAVAAPQKTDWELDETTVGRQSVHAIDTLRQQKVQQVTDRCLIGAIT